jgi:hypothetical protein
MADLLTAQQVIDRIQSSFGSSWKSTSSDVFLAGDPKSKVTGIVTTWTPTLDVLRRAAASGKNLIISRESPFWDRGAAVAGYSGAGAAIKKEVLAQNPTYQKKLEFLDKSKLVVWRFFDNWNSRQPDGQRVGLVKALASSSPSQELLSRT